jgi:hypothetical protein
MRCSYKLLIALVVISFSIRSFSQKTLEYKYFVGITAPDPNWKSKDFNDSFWLTGKGSIGYGDNDDSILIDTVAALYLRYNLKVNKEITKALIIYADFDDGFIAYLNGNKILTVNMDTSIHNPVYLQTTTRSHENTNIGKPYIPYLGYYIDSAQVCSSVQDSLNVLSFEVHNDSIKGSDLSFDFNYLIVDTGFSFSYNINSNYHAIPKSDSIQLPIIVIETDEYGISENTTIAKMGIINNPSGRFNKLSDKYTDYNGRIRTKLHGTSSLSRPKKSMRIELQDSVGNNNNISLLGMPKENDWILYAPFQDMTLIKNEFTYNLGRKMGNYTPRTRFCEVIINGEDKGVFVLTEKIKRDKNRVNITKLTPDDNEGTSLTGGYILVMNNGFEIDYPSIEDITPAQLNYIRDYFAKSQKVITNDPVNGYKKFFEENSLVDYIIVSELSMNCDAYLRSCYLYKDNDAIDSRFKFGPFWDYDVAWYYYDNQLFDQWKYGSNLNVYGMLQDTSLSHQLVKTWHTYRKGFLSNDSIISLIDGLVDIYKPSIERNYQVWPILQYNWYGKNTHETYNDKITPVKTWIMNRANWIDENIDAIYSTALDNASIGNLVYTTKKNSNMINSYPNPCKEKLYVILNLDKPGQIIFEICDITGRKCCEFNQENRNSGHNEFELSFPTGIKPGVYTLRVLKGSFVITNQTIVKIE